MNRITKKDLEFQVDQINRHFNLPLEPYTRTDGKFSPNAGVFHLSYAYGGVSLHKMSVVVGCTGVDDVFRCGHVPKRELHNRLCAFRAGLSENS